MNRRGAPAARRLARASRSLYSSSDPPVRPIVSSRMKRAGRVGRKVAAPRTISGTLPRRRIEGDARDWMKPQVPVHLWGACRSKLLAVLRQRPPEISFVTRALTCFFSWRSSVFAACGPGERDQLAARVALALEPVARPGKRLVVGVGQDRGSSSGLRALGRRHRHLGPPSRRIPCSPSRRSASRPPRMPCAAQGTSSRSSARPCRCGPSG